MSSEIDKTKARIFIVENEVITAADLENSLQELGYAVCGKASNCNEALELIERRRPDLVMMDIVLQGDMDGIEAAGLIRDNWGIPVVFLTAYADSDRLERARLTHPFGYLLKPFQDRDLKITTEMALYAARVDAERKGVEEKLRESEQKYRLLFTHAPTGILEVDFTTGCFTRVNSLICDYTGYSEEELLTMGALNILTEESQIHFLERLDKINKGESVPVNPEFFIKNKDGSTRWVQLNVDFMRQENRITGATVVIHDITARKRTEEALRKSEERYRSLFEEAGEGILLSDQNATIVNANQKALKMLEYSSSEIIGLNAVDLIHPDDLKAIPVEFTRQQVRDGSLVTIERRFRTASGRYIPVDVSVSFIPNAGIHQVFFQDITERKRAEEEKEQLQAQLRHAHKMEAVGTLAAGIAHEFNNHPQAITGYTQLLLMYKPKNDPDRHGLNAIQKAGERAAVLVRQLLLFARKAEARRRPVNLNQEIERARKMLERDLPGVIDIEVIPGGGLWTILADPAQIGQLLLNLGTNAADAMPAGGKLLIETKNAALGEAHAKVNPGVKPANYVLLTVSDFGQGMDKETVKHIFDPFFTTKEIGKGTGLGLASVYGIVQSHGGYINCQSEVGRGTTFKIYLPAMEQPKT
ncbi:MAG: PAS domain S-box protein [Pseudomonadota bacterium]